MQASGEVGESASLWKSAESRLSSGNLQTISTEQCKVSTLCWLDPPLTGSGKDLPKSWKPSSSDILCPSLQLNRVINTWGGLSLEINLLIELNCSYSWKFTLVCCLSPKSVPCSFTRHSISNDVDKWLLGARKQLKALLHVHIKQITNWQLSLAACISRINFC